MPKFSHTSLLTFGLIQGNLCGYIFFACCFWIVGKAPSELLNLLHFPLNHCLVLCNLCLLGLTTHLSSCLLLFCYFLSQLVPF